MATGTAIVTGGAGMLGAAIGEALREDGWTVRLVDMKAAVEASDLKSKFQMDVLDVTDFEACKAYMSQLSELSVLVNCAGIARIHPIVGFDLDTWQKVLDVNLTAPLVLTQLAAPLLARSGHGAIVNITSISGKRAGFGRVAYGTSKAALEHLTYQTAMEFAAYGIRCNAVAPGPVESKMVLDALSEEDLEDYLGDIPQGRLGKPREIAVAVAFLASPEASHITGHCMPVDGGFTTGGSAIRKAQKLKL